MKLNMKKMISAVIAFAMSASMLPQIASAADITWEARTNAVDLRVGITADTHVTTTSNVFEFNRPISAFKQIDEGMDAVLLAGDIIYGEAGADQAHFENCYDIIEDNYDNYFDPASTPMLYAMGNHEFPINGKDDKATFSHTAFQNKIGDLNQTNVVNGYTFITAAPQDYFGVLTAETEEYVMNAANAAIAKDANKPVFLTIHHPTNDQYGTNQSYYSETFYEWLHTTPQIIMFTAHTHNSAQTPSMISQVKGGYTVINAPYAGNSTYSIRSGGVSTTLDDAKKAIDRYTWNCAREAMLLEAEGNTVKIYVMDILNGRYVGEPYVIDIPSLVAGTGYSYTDERFEKSTGPEFPADATLTVTEDAEAQGTIKVEFSNNAVKETESQTGYQDDFVFAYKVSVEDTAGGYVLKSVNVAGEFYLPEESHSETLATTFEGLEAGKTYTVSVAPMSAFLAEGTALRKDITISGEKATYTKLAEWTPRKDSIVTKEIDGTTYRVLENNVDSGKYPLDMWNQSTAYRQNLLPISDATYSQLYYTEPFSSDNPIYGHYPVINGGDLALAMNDGFTVDTWVQIRHTGRTKIFGVYDYNEEGTTTETKYIPKFQIAYDPSASEGNGGIKIERMTTDGTNTTKVSKFASRLTYGEWYHIAATVNKSGEVPVFTFYVNGEKISQSTLTAYETASATDTSVAFEADDLVVFAGPGAWSHSSDVRISDTAIYQEQLGHGAVMDSYYKNAGDFDYVFDTKVENMQGSVVSYASLKSLNKDDIKRITVDLSDAANVTKANFEIYNVTDQESVDFNYRLDGTTAVIAGAAWEDNKSYKFIIRDVEDANGNLLRCSNQVLELTTVSAKSYEKLAEWIPHEFASTTVNGVTSKFILNNADNANYALNMAASSGTNALTPVHDIPYNERYDIVGSNLYAYIPVTNSVELMKKMDDGFTLDMWFIANKTVGNNVFNIRRQYTETSTDSEGNTTSTTKYQDLFKIGFTGSTGNNDVIYVRRLAKVDGVEKEVSMTHSPVVTGSALKWNHLVVSMGSSKEENREITLYLNGQKITTQTDASPISFTSKIGENETGYICLGGPRTWGNATTARFSNTTIYGDVIDEATALASYQNSATHYETVFNSELCDRYGNVFTLEQLDFVTASKVSTFNVDLTANAANVTKANFEIYCKDTAENVDFNLSNNGSVYTLAGFTLKDDMEYQFIVKNIADASGNALKANQQVLNVTTAKAVSYDKLAQWTFDADAVVTKEIDGTTYRVVENDVNSTKYPINMWNQKGDGTYFRHELVPVGDNIYSQKYRTDPLSTAEIYGHYPVINSGDLAVAMNDGFTLETWINIAGDGQTTIFGIYDTDAGGFKGTEPKLRIGYYPSSTSGDVKIERKTTDGENITTYAKLLKGLPKQEWHHMAVTVNKSGEVPEIQFYINGEKVDFRGNDTAYHTAADTDTGVAYDNDDLIVFAGPGAWGNGSAVRISDPIIYSGAIDAAAIATNYNNNAMYYEAMFDSQLNDKYDEVITLDGIGSVSTSEVKSFTVDLTESAANVTKDNFEIYCVDTAQTVDFTLSNEGTVYTLSDFTLQADKDYQFIVKDVVDADGNAVRKTWQVLDVHTVAPGEIEITAASVAEDGTISATVKNYADTAKPAVLVVATYNGTQLADMDYIDLGTLDADGEITPETIDVKGGEGITVKFMLWNSFSAMTPYQPALVK